MLRYYGNWGGQFVPETLIPALDELEEAFEAFRKDRDRLSELAALLSELRGQTHPPLLRAPA